jgi:hypothetical protein
MPSRRLPNSTPAVTRTLVTARETYKNTANPADRAITADQFAQLDDTDPNSLLNRFIGDVNAVDLAEAAQAPLTSSLNRSAARATQLVSHFHQVLDLGVARGTFAPGARSYYGRDISATTIPDLADYNSVSEAVDAIVAGEAARKKAEGAAYVPMALPSAAEVGTAGAQFKTLRGQSQNALVNTEQQREVLNTLYPQAQALAVDICDTVEFFYRKETDEGTRRTKCQRWGVVYIYDQPAPPAPAPAPAATPPQP